MRFERKLRACDCWCTCVQTQQLANRATTANALLRQHVLERVVPAVASLKSFLEESRHPLQHNALQCLVQLMLEHKEHMEEALVTQRQLAAEIKFNIQEAERARKAARKAAGGAAAGAARPSATPAADAGVVPPLQHPATPSTFSPQQPLAFVQSPVSRRHWLM